MSIIEEQLKEHKIVAVIVIKSEDEIVPCMEALLEGGIRVIELALRTPFSLNAARKIAVSYPEILLGLGTVLTTDQVKAASEVPAHFAVAPGLNCRVIEYARKLNLPFYPGVATPSDIEAALEYNIRLLKFFPAEPMGGLEYLKSIHAPYAHLGAKYIPLGGVNQDNLKDYLKSDCIAAVGGTWLASRKLIEEANWREILRISRAAIAVRDNM